MAVSDCIEIWTNLSICDVEDDGTLLIRESPHMGSTTSKEFIKFEQQLNKKYNKKLAEENYTKINFPAIGEDVVVMHNTRWFRGIIKGKSEKNLVKYAQVYLIDYGISIETNKPSMIYVLKDGQYAEVNIQAKRIKIMGIVPKTIDYSLQNGVLKLAPMPATSFDKPAIAFIKELSELTTLCEFHCVSVDEKDVYTGHLYIDVNPGIERKLRKSTKEYKLKSKESLGDILVMTKFALPSNFEDSNNVLALGDTAHNKEEIVGHSRGLLPYSANLKPRLPINNYPSQPLVSDQYCGMLDDNVGTQAPQYCGMSDDNFGTQEHNDTFGMSEHSDYSYGTPEKDHFVTVVNTITTKTARISYSQDHQRGSMSCKYYKKSHYAKAGTAMNQAASFIPKKQRTSRGRYKGSKRSLYQAENNPKHLFRNLDVSDDHSSSSSEAVRPKLLNDSSSSSDVSLASTPIPRNSFNSGFPSIPVPTNSFNTASQLKNLTDSNTADDNYKSSLNKTLDYVAEKEDYTEMSEFFRGMTTAIPNVDRQLSEQFKEGLSNKREKANKDDRRLINNTDCSKLMTLLPETPSNKIYYFKNNKKNEDCSNVSVDKLSPEKNISDFMFIPEKYAETKNNTLMQPGLGNMNNNSGRTLPIWASSHLVNSLNNNPEISPNFQVLDDSSSSIPDDISVMSSHLYDSDSSASKSDVLSKNYVEEDISFHKANARTCRVYCGGFEGAFLKNILIKFDDAKSYLNEHIYNVLKREKFTISELQKFSWQVFSSNSSCVLIGNNKHSDKIHSYIIPLLSSLLDNVTEKRPKIYGPMMVVVCSTWRKVETIACDIKTLLPRSSLNVLQAWGGIGKAKEDELHCQLLTACDILVITAGRMARLIKSMAEDVDSITISFSKCMYMILDDADDICATSPNELDLIINEWSSGVPGSDMKQIVVTGSHWSIAIDDLYLKVTKLLPTKIIIANHLEAAVAVKVMNKVHFVPTYTDPCYTAINTLKKQFQKCKTLIFVDSDNEGMEIKKLMNSIAVSSSFISSDELMCNVRLILNSWNNSSNSVIIVCEKPQNCLYDYDVRNADIIVHISLPENKHLFGRRYSFMLDHYPVKLNEKCRAISYLFLNEENVKKHPYVIDELKRMGSDIPKEILQDQSETKTFNKENNIDLCYYIKAFGQCNVWDCRWRHHMIGKDFPKFVPISGEIEIKIASIIDASRYMVIIKKYSDPFSKKVINVQDFDKVLSLCLQSYFYVEQNRLVLQSFAVGTLCAVYDTNKSLWFRGKIVRNKCELSVLFIDKGFIKNFQRNKVYSLPKHFCRMPPLCIEVFLCDIKPVDYDISWTLNANNEAKSLLKTDDATTIRGRINFALNNTLWVGPLRSMKKIGTTFCLGENLRTKLCASKFAENNPEHMRNLKKLYDESDLPFVKEQEHNWLHNYEMGVQMLTKQKGSDDSTSDVHSEEASTDSENKVLCVDDSFKTEIPKHISASFKAESVAMIQKNIGTTFKGESVEMIPKNIATVFRAESTSSLEALNSPLLNQSSSSEILNIHSTSSETFSDSSSKVSRSPSEIKNLLRTLSNEQIVIPTKTVKDESHSKNEKLYSNNLTKTKSSLQTESISSSEEFSDSLSKKRRSYSEIINILRNAKDEKNDKQKNNPSPKLIDESVAKKGDNLSQNDATEFNNLPELHHVNSFPNCSVYINSKANDNFSEKCISQQEIKSSDKLSNDKSIKTENIKQTKILSECKEDYKIKYCDKDNIDNCKPPKETVSEKEIVASDKVFCENEINYSEKETITSEKETITSEKETITSEKETITSEKETITSEKETFPSEKEAITSERERIPSEKERIPFEKEAITSKKDNSDISESLTDTTNDEIDYNDLKINVDELELFINPNLFESNIDESPSDFPPYVLSEESLDVGTLIQVNVEEIYSPINFYITKCCNEVSIHHLENEIQSAVKMLEVVKGMPDDVCLAQFSNGRFYRAKITDIYSDAYEVFFIDYGETEVIQNDKIYPCPQSIFKFLPPQAIHCCLANITVLDHVKATEMMEDILDETDNWKLNVLDFEFDNNERRYIVDLISTNGEQEISLIDILADNQVVKKQDNVLPAIMQLPKIMDITDEKDQGIDLGNNSANSEDVACNEEVSKEEKYIVCEEESSLSNKILSEGENALKVMNKNVNSSGEIVNTLEKTNEDALNREEIIQYVKDQIISNVVTESLVNVENKNSSVKSEEKDEDNSINIDKNIPVEIEKDKNTSVEIVKDENISVEIEKVDENTSVEIGNDNENTSIEIKKDNENNSVEIGKDDENTSVEIKKDENAFVEFKKDENTSVENKKKEMTLLEIEKEDQTSQKVLNEDDMISQVSNNVQKTAVEIKNKDESCFLKPKPLVYKKISNDAQFSKIKKHKSKKKLACTKCPLESKENIPELEKEDKNTVFHPEVFWGQDMKNIYLQIPLPDIISYEYRCMSKSLKLWVLLNNKDYVINEDLFSYVDPDNSTFKILGMNIKIVLAKMEKMMWPSLFSQNEKRPWLKRDLNYVEDSDVTEEEETPAFSDFGTSIPESDESKLKKNRLPDIYTSETGSNSSTSSDDDVFNSKE